MTVNERATHAENDISRHANDRLYMAAMVLREAPQDPECVALADRIDAIREQLSIIAVELKALSARAN